MNRQSPKNNRKVRWHKLLGYKYPLVFFVTTIWYVISMLNLLDTKRRNQTDLNISLVPHEAQKPFFISCSSIYYGFKFLSIFFIRFNKLKLKLKMNIPLDF